MAPFWLKLANTNGLHRDGVWENGPDRPKRAQIERCITSALDHDIIFQLDQWPEPNQAAPSPLIYFRDHGMLRRLLDAVDKTKREAIAEIAGSEERFRAERKLVDKRQRRDDRSWEGFVVDALRVLTNGVAETFVWRRDPDEIDLILRWRSGALWGVEVTRGKGSRKKPTDGFFEGCRQLGITERFVVAPVAVERVRHGVACFDLSEALARTREELP